MEAINFCTGSTSGLYKFGIKSKSLTEKHGDAFHYPE